jgi:hypothetical protein
MTGPFSVMIIRPRRSARTALALLAAMMTVALSTQGATAQDQSVLTYHDAHRSGNFIIPALTWDKGPIAAVGSRVRRAPRWPRLRAATLLAWFGFE